MQSKIPPHRCLVFDYGVENNGQLVVRCRVCAKTVLWCDLPTVGGGLRFEFLEKGARHYDDGMWLTPDEAERAR